MRAGSTLLALLMLAALPAIAFALDASVRSAVSERIAASGADVAVAFRTLDGKDELLIQPDRVFHAASTMKVPVLIDLYARAHEGTLRLDGRIPVRNRFRSLVDGSPFSLDPSEDSEAGLYQRVGGEASYRELAELMITESSNLATNLLIDRLGAEEIEKRVTALGAPGMKVLRGVEDEKAFEAGRNNTTTARALMVLLQAIAEGKAVDPQSSREMVAILKRQHFNESIPAGLPPGTPVAHKTGTITRIHHDAAIVYAPRPFVLVILVRGLDDQAESAALMADLARILYRATQPAR